MYICSFSRLFLQSVLDHHLFLYTKCLHTGLMVPSFLSLENPLSDSYTFIRTLTRLTMYMYNSRLLVYDIVKFLCDLVTVSLLNVLVTIIRFVLEPIGFAYVTAPIHLSSYCIQYTLSRNRD